MAGLKGKSGPPGHSARRVLILNNLRMVGGMTREETKKRLDELAREYCATHNPNIVEELYRLARELEKMEKLEKQ